MAATKFTAVCLATVLANAHGSSTFASDCDASEFDEWAKKHGHDNFVGDRDHRFSTFCETKSIVNAHNKKYQQGKSTFFMSLNKFSAHTPEERERLMGFRRQEIEPVASTFDGSKAKGEVSALYQNNVSAVDWRLHGKVSSVKNQGQCGSCWAFSAIGAMEGAISIAEGFTWNTSDVNEGYSVDQCLECTPGTMGCQGGWPWLCFDHIIENGGIDSEKDWPYLSESCDAAKEKFEKVAAISAYKNISDGDEEGLRRALVQQPVSIGVRANCDAFMHYGGGVLDEDCGGGERQIDHAILAVGYNLTAKTPYYIVKNSWGSGWGEDGYVRMKVGDNLDCIACKATYPVSAKEQPPQPPTPEIKCPTGTFDPSLKEPPTCPKGSNCCCGRNYFWKKGQCKDTFCCLEDEVCYNQFGKHGCYKKSQNVSSSA